MQFNKKTLREIEYNYECEKPCVVGLPIDEYY